MALSPTGEAMARGLREGRCLPEACGQGGKFNVSFEVQRLFAPKILPSRNERGEIVLQDRQRAATPATAKCEAANLAVALRRRRDVYCTTRRLSHEVG